MKKKILIMAGYYLPGVKGGGPIQSIKNIVGNLSNDFEFYIIASDRDLGDEIPFENVITDEWIMSDNNHILYTDSESLTYSKLQKIMNSIKYDVLYLNSYFSYNYSIKPILLQKMKRISKTKTIVAPRGQFSIGALNLKNSKKRLFIRIGNLLGFYKDIIWHATADTEKKEIENTISTTKKIIVANNMTTNYEDLKFEKKICKNEGELSVIFISRIHPKKNLLTAINVLNKVKGKIIFDIYGPIEDQEYWNKCEKAISTMNSNIKVNYLGLAPHKKIMNLFLNHHIFLFPTLGENYGHVISEALIGGCPVIISDRTPWRKLKEIEVGWDISLENEEEFVNAVQMCANMTIDDYNKMSKSAFEFAKKDSNQIASVNKIKELFS